MNRAVAIAFLLVALLAIPAGAALTPQAADNNTTTQHVDPDATNGNGDLDALSGVLERELASRLRESAIQISQGQYEQGRDLLGDEYSETLGKYVDVAGDTGNDGDGESFRRARTEQQQYAERVQEYNETRREYLEAKENGNERRARRLARELQRDARNVTQASRNVTRSYTVVENETGADLSVATNVTQNTTDEIQRQQADIRAAEFTPTTVTLDEYDESISFREPLSLTGRLTDENGTALADRRIRLRIERRSITTRTNETGAFSLAYRPVRLPTGTTAVRVAYVPDSTSVYLGSNATTNVSVSMVIPTVSLSTSTDRASYRDPVDASGEVTVDNAAVSDVPVVLTADGHVLARGTTGKNGSFSLSGRLPASVSTATEQLSVRVGGDDRAIGPASTNASFRVEPTATRLTVATQVGDTLDVTGRLETADGLSLSGQPVTVQVNGSRVATVRTNATGAYAASVPVPNASVAQVTAVYSGGGNLNGSEASTRLRIPARGDDASDFPVLGRNGEGSNTPSVLVLVGSLIVLALGGVGLFLAWGRVSADEGPISSAVEEPQSDSPDGAMETPADPFEPLTEPRSILEDDPTAAVERAYAAVRQRVGDASLESATHWEFYRAVEPTVSDADALDRLTRAYEAAAFSPEGIDATTAAEAIDAAEAVR
ncbi:DUF4129 domain-containing protein [Natronomonas sp. EA1]|uniref:DUF4129 domain-containing protein n=1 Tax=Natronomonas sp. EA1 TaxID=3421655 RepID=UPI003EBE869A